MGRENLVEGFDYNAWYRLDPRFIRALGLDYAESPRGKSLLKYRFKAELCGSSLPSRYVRIPFHAWRKNGTSMEINVLHLIKIEGLSEFPTKEEDQMLEMLGYILERAHD